jgi:glucosamine kinase
VTPSLKLGIDGGGTKTELILVNEQGIVVAQHRAPACNPSVVGEVAARQALHEAITALRYHAPDPIRATLLCMAGNRQFWRDTAASFSKAEFGHVTAVADSIPVLELATQGNPGLVIHAGTGSFIALRTTDHAAHYLGGLGWKLGDPGSGYDIGRRAIATGLLETQYSQTTHAARSALLTALCAYTGQSDYNGLSGYFYHSHPENAQISGFASHVLTLADQGCEDSHRILIESLSELARQVGTALHQFFPHQTALIPCGLSGPILNHPLARTTLQTFAHTHHWPVHLHPLTAPPIEGVRQLLLKL